jgi:hypothetical protein
MALEKSLWQRLKGAGARLRDTLGLRVHLTRIENGAGEGTPDVDGCVECVQVWIEMKSCKRPARPTTPIRPKKREAQEIWLRTRCEAGCKTCYVLIQVGDAANARLYLIPGHMADKITAPEQELAKMSLLPADCNDAEAVLLRAIKGW